MNLKLSIETIRAVTAADSVDSNALAKTFLIQNIVIDSRSPRINEHTLFILLKGHKTSGIHYVADFMAKGGRVVLTDEPLNVDGLTVIQVKDALTGLQKIARHHREKFQIPVIGITGSNGKTTVKEWLYHVLSPDFKIVRSPKSYNSQIGVALSVLELDDWYDLAIFEAGISQPGEMEKLEEMIQPTIGLFTGIGDAHNSGFNSVNPEVEKRAEKYKLFKKVDRLIAVEEEEILVRKDDNETHFKTTLPGNGKFVLKTAGKNVESATEFTIPFFNQAAVSNASMVVLTAGLLGLAEEKLVERLKTLPAISMRLEQINGKNDNLLINDVYSLDERSLEIGLQYLNANRENRKAALFIAEDPELTTKATSLLNALDQMKRQVALDHVVYFGNAAIAARFDFVDRIYAQTTDFAQHPFELKHTAILFTGSRNCHLEHVVNAFTEKKHITRLQVNLRSMRHNLNVFRGKLAPETSVLAMVKAQSYGGGSVEVARFLQAEKIACFGVAYADEGVRLRENGITVPVLVMNPEPAAFDEMIDYELEPSIYSADLLNAFIHQLILRQKKNYPIHLKLDTGMNRLGFREKQFQLLFEMLSAQPEVYVASVFSHLSVADDATEQEYTHKQIAKFTRLTDEIERRLGYGFKRHLANSAGSYYYPNAHFDMVRLGIGLFGLLSKDENAFEPVLTLQSKLSQIRHIEKGESVGYGRQFIAAEGTNLGVVPVGYADGLRRALSKGKWQVVIEGQKYPIIGNICMDMCMVDLGSASLPVGTDVQLFGPGNTIEEMSRILNTIPYEIISAISARVHRVYIEE